MHEKALELEEETLNEKGKAIQLSNLGLIYLEKNELGKSELFLNQALKVSTALNDVRSQAILYKHFAKLAIAQNELNTSETFIQKGLKIDVEGNNRYGEAESYRLLADVYKLKNDEEYKVFYSKALAIYKELSLKNQIAELESQLSKMN